MPRRYSNSELLAWALVGTAVGLAAGFAASEWLGPMDRTRAAAKLRALTSGDPEAPRPAGGTVTLRAVQVALAQDPELTRLALEVVAAGRGAVELHGWVPNRRLRAHAGRLVAATPGITSLLNCLLVRGEDDAGLSAVETNDQTA